MSLSPEYDQRYRESGPLRYRGDGVIDEIAVERALSGTYDPSRLTHQEITEAVRMASQQGLNDARIAERLGISPAAVFKRRKRNLPESIGRAS